MQWSRRVALTGAALMVGLRGSEASSNLGKDNAQHGVIDAVRDFRVPNDGQRDAHKLLQSALDAGSTLQCPVVLQPGAYRLNQPLRVNPNCMLLGAAPGLGFGCRLEPVGCPALRIGEATPCFHACIESLTIWPKGPTAEYIIQLANSYSVSLRNIRIHNAQVSKAVVWLSGGAESSRRSSNIIWDNLIVRNDDRSSTIAILADANCGTHTFYSPDLENHDTLIEWRGGNLDLYAPYTERAGKYGIHCVVTERDASFATFGGAIRTSRTGVACGIRALGERFTSFGTLWGQDADTSIHVYAKNASRAVFHGISPNAMRMRVSGIRDWQECLSFPDDQ